MRRDMGLVSRILGAADGAIAAGALSAQRVNGAVPGEKVRASPKKRWQFGIAESLQSLSAVMPN